MQAFYKKLLYSTLEYGQGYDRQVELEESKLLRTEMYDCAATKGANLIDYHLHKIAYNLKENQNIQSIQLIFKNVNDGNLVNLVDTDPAHPKTNEFILEDDEEINEVRMWTKNDCLIGFEISTTKGRFKKIGYDSDQTIKIREFQDHDKIIYGFGFQANTNYGVSSMFCYYMDKKKYGIIKNREILKLRAKMKKNPEFKKELEDKKGVLTDEERLILSVCSLPDASFFPVASYLISY